jgi:hypothetical protein
VNHIAPRPEALGLALYDTMCRAIDAAFEVDEIKDIRDRGIAFERYAQQARNHEAEDRARKVRLRAERRCGELLSAQEMAKGARGNPGGRGAAIVPSDDTRTLADLNISYDQSSQWQKLAAVPKPEFEADLADPDWRPSTSGIIERHEARQRPPPPKDLVDHDALWLWGRLQDFDRLGLLDRDPAEVMATMLEHMRETTMNTAPRVAAWLGSFK